MVKGKARATYSKRSSSVKPTLEQERELQQIEEEEGATRSDMMREALKDYLAKKRLRRVGRDLRKDPVRALHEAILKEQLDPLKEEVESVSESLRAVAQTLSNFETRNSSTPILSPAGQAEADSFGALMEAYSGKFEAIFRVLDQVFFFALTSQELLVQYLIEPRVATAEREGVNRCLELVESARGGGTMQSQTTQMVIGLIKNRMADLMKKVVNEICEDAGWTELIEKVDPEPQEQIAESEIVAVT